MDTSPEQGFIQRGALDCPPSLNSPLPPEYLKIYLDYGNFKLTNQVARNAGSIFHSHLVSGIYSWPLAPSSGFIGTLVANGLNGHCPISFSAVV